MAAVEASIPAAKLGAESAEAGAAEIGSEPMGAWAGFQAPIDGWFSAPTDSGADISVCLGQATRPIGRDVHLRRVIEPDPEHVKARRALGYRRTRRWRLVTVVAWLKE